MADLTNFSYTTIGNNYIARIKNGFNGHSYLAVDKIGLVHKTDITLATKLESVEEVLEVAAAFYYGIAYKK